MADTFQVNLSNYKDRSGSRIQPGTYKAIVEDLEATETRDGKPMINVFLRVLDGEFEGSTLIDRLLPEHEKALFRVVNFMQGVGLPTPKKNVQFRADQVVGRTVEIEVDDGDPYMGKVKSEVRGYNRLAKSQQPQQDIEDIADESTEQASDDSEVDLDSVNL